MRVDTTMVSAISRLVSPRAARVATSRSRLVSATGCGAVSRAGLRAPSQRAALADCAAEVGASERTLARLFRDELGTTYQQWRQQAILAHALPMLARGVPVSHVAASSGYASDSAFTAMFKAAMFKGAMFKGVASRVDRSVTARSRPLARRP